MLKSVELINYKCFKEKTDIEISPLTMLCGVNSSGKSSILKSLLMLKQTATSKTSDISIMFSGDLVDCGTFEDIINDGIASQEFMIRNTFRINNHKLTATGKYIQKQDAKTFNELRRMYYAIIGEIKYFQLEFTVTVKKIDGGINEFSKYIESNFISSYMINIKVFDLDENEIKDYSGYIFLENKLNNDSHVLSWDNIPNIGQEKNSFASYKCVCSFNGLAISNIFAYNMPNAVKQVVPNILAISRIIATQYDGINYIAPLRNTPERTYIIRKNVDSVGINGEDTPTLLAKIKNQRVTTDVFCPYTNTKSIDQNGYITTDYHSVIQQWLDYFGIGNLSLQGDKGVVSVNIGQHNISDIGFGMSQILPIITQGIIMDKEQTLLIEQPEIHLHPKMELQMADFLIQLSKTGRNVIIETHSELIKTRIIRRIIEDDNRQLKNNINIYFVTQNEAGLSEVQCIDFDDEYGIKHNPAEFFDQAAFEQLELMKAGLSKRRKIKDNIV